MGSLAADLKTEREKRKISLEQIAADTRISKHYLESLEGGRYNELPGGIYNRAFLRAYCESLSVDQQEMMRRYDTEVAATVEKPPKPRVHIPQKDSSFKVNPIVIWSCALLISAVGIFFSRNWIAAVFSPYFSRKPAVILPRPPEQRAVRSQPSQYIAPEIAQPGAPTSSSSEITAGETASDQSPAAQPAPVQSTLTPTAAALDSTPPPLQSSLQLEVDATERCWIYVERDGARSLRKLMEPGEVQRLYASDRFFVVLGNAGGVRLRINGKLAKPLGKPGEVVKILINQTNLHDYLDQAPGQ